MSRPARDGTLADNARITFTILDRPGRKEMCRLARRRQRAWQAQRGADAGDRSMAQAKALPATHAMHRAATGAFPAAAPWYSRAASRGSDAVIPHPAPRPTQRGQHVDLVADVEKYPYFLPLCTGLRVRKRAQDAQGRDVLTADMSVGYKAIRETFTSRVTLDRPKLEILVEYIDGPFSKLENGWTFADLPPAGNAESKPESKPACEIDFYIDYEFRSRMLGMLMGTMFETAFRRFARAFERRADIVYGRRGNIAKAATPGDTGQGA